MGTSLSGLTPANTYQSLIKVGDNSALSATLKALSDGAGNDSPLKLSTTAVQIVSPLRISTDDPSDMYLDCEDGSQNNRFNITRNTSSQQVNLNFASNPAGSTTTVGAIRTYVDGTNLSEVMTFREDGNVGIGTTTPTARLRVITADTNGIAEFFQNGVASSPLHLTRYTGLVGINLNSAAGGSTSPTPVGDNISLSRITTNTYNGTAFGVSARIEVHTKGVQSATNYGSIMRFLTTPENNINTNEVLSLLSDGNVQIGSSYTLPLGAKLGIKGSGSTSATTSLLVQNSSGNTSFRVYDDRIVEVPYRIYTPFISNQSGNLVLYSGNFEVEIQSSNPTNGSGSLRTTGEITTTDNQTKSIININNLVPSTSASFNTLNGFAFTSAITQTTGTIRGLFINPTLNASTDFRAIETTRGDVLLATTSGNVGIGTTAPVTKLQVNGVTALSNADLTGYNLYSPFNIVRNGATSMAMDRYTGAPHFNFRAAGGTIASPSTQVGELGKIDFWSYSGTSFNQNVRLIAQAENFVGGFAQTQRLSIGMGETGTNLDYYYEMVNGNSYFGASAFGTTPTARVQIKGSGSTSATTSLLVQNSSGNRLLETKDNGDLYVGNTASNTGTIVVPHSPTYVDRVFMSIDGGFPLFSTISNALLEISCAQFYTKGNMVMRNLNEGIIGQTAYATNNSSIQLTTTVNSYGGTSQDDACNFLYVKNNGTILQANGSVNWIKMDGTVNEAGGGGAKWCTGIYYNPTLTGGTLLANSHYCYHATSGQMMVNTTSPQSSAQLQVDSTTRGFLPPRMTNAERLAIASPAIGLEVYCTDAVEGKYIYKSTGWTFVA